MRILRGLEESRELLLRNRGFGKQHLPTQDVRQGVGNLTERSNPLDSVSQILHEVREGGDNALRRLTKKFDHCDVANLEIERETITNSYSKVPAELVEALKLSAQRIRDYHEATLPKSWFDSTKGYGELINPVERVGCYVPGGTAALISTLLMTVIPAKIAGVEEVVVASPLGRDGTISDGLLVSADIAGVDRFFQLGGAQAIGALAYGTESVPQVDLVCGPGNIYVTLAKKLVWGDVGVDGLFGPTETMIIADHSANPTLCSVDLLAQAEHDILATPILVTTSERIAAEVSKEIRLRVKHLERTSIANEAITNRGVIAIVQDIGEALKLANNFAPEHLCLMIENPSFYTDQVRNAGVVFIGDFSHEVLGDYVAGPSHVMPTGGTARFSSGLGVRTFLKFTPLVGLDQATSASLTKTASVIGRAEGLTGHAEAAEIREEFHSQ